MKTKLQIVAYYSVLFIALGWLLVTVLGQYFEARHELTDSKAAYVYEICNQAHNEFNGYSELQCGDIQDKTHTEFLCDKTGNHCWVEAK